ncbi:hypothetical protein LTSEINV_2223 [Salmonella enterica subsp. enterica serovar Inverness str. R8-3668]|uniref:Uncharacterized protein n=1 Tax=Salmonella enterica subsp. enterica serovar Inverness str. R8-3668 TaxID=913075 RepID=G5NCC1_SALET|nr:hypothetical protein LTSEINV_2223 [Salmonella enterica subsp. enterica serovar Inverness str. R8-3668]
MSTNNALTFPGPQIVTLVININNNAKHFLFVINNNAKHFLLNRLF